MLNLSKYNFYKKTKDSNILIYNCCSDGIYLLDKKYKNILKNFNDCINDDNYVEEIKKLKEQLYIVDFDELDLIKHQFYKSAFDSSILGLTICPTLCCNLACTYCYENKNQSSMSDQTIDNMIEFLKKVANNTKHLSVTWYGGEPLLDKKVIKKINEKIQKFVQDKNITYDAYMISNCLLLDEKNIDILSELKIREIQVTLDGTEEFHDKRRIGKNGEPTFKRTIEKIKLLNKNNISVSLRINVDNENVVSLDRLMKIISDEGIKANVYLGHIQANTEACKSNENICMNKTEFYDLNFDFINKNKEKYKDLVFNEPVPTKKNVFCGANKEFSFVIDANGNVYKCWNEVGQKNLSIYNVNDTKNVNYENLLRYEKINPFENKKCRKCKCLPICLGGCPYNRMMGMNDCSNMKYLISEYLDNIIKEKNLW